MVALVPEPANTIHPGLPAEDLPAEDLSTGHGLDRRVALVANTSWYLYNFRLPLIRELKASGYDVHLIAPEDPYSAQLREEGFHHHPWLIKRQSINPLLELQALLDLVRLYSQIRPKLVHHFTLKACLYGTLAAKGAHVPHVINAVTGLGHFFLAERKRSRLLRKFAKIPYRAVFSARRSTVVFQNAADQELLVQMGLVRSSQTSVIRGSGVDLERFQPRSEPRHFHQPARLLFPSRLIREKGVIQLLTALERLHRRGLGFELWIAGELDDGNRSTLLNDEHKALLNHPCVRVLGHVSDMVALYDDVDIVVLPSYREGLSKALIEAAAMQKPIITSDVPGCRDVVDHGISGLLVPPRDSRALALAMELLLHQPDLARTFGLAARSKVAKEFAVELVNQRTLAAYKELLST